MKFILPFLLLAVVNGVGTDYAANWLIPRYAEEAVVPLWLAGVVFSTLWIAGLSFRSEVLKVLSLVAIAALLFATSGQLGWPFGSAAAASVGAVFILVILPIVWNAIVSGVLHLIGWLAGDANMLYDPSLEPDVAYD